MSERILHRRRTSAALAGLALAAFAAGLLLPAGTLVGGDGLARPATGAQLLRHAAFVAFPLSMFGALAAPAGLWAVLGRSRTARLSAGASFFLAAIAGPLLCATAWGAGATVAWAGAGIAMAGAAGVQRGA